jgi:arylesterase/paraoxonase
MLKRIILFLLVLFLLALIWMAYLFWSAGELKSIEPHFSGACTQVAGLSGAEDITIHPKTAVAYISAYDRRADFAGEAGRGGIYAYDLNSASPQLVNLTPDADEDFKPHGISLYVGEDGRDALFVINHVGGTHHIEVYDLVEGRLSHRESLSDPLLVSPNDLVAVGPDSVYVSNDHRYASGLMQDLEDYLQLKLSNVLFYDGSRFIEAVSGIGYANGINVGSDGKTLFLCALGEKALHVYDRDISSGVLTRRDKIELGTGIDNIEVDTHGGLWIGAHPKLLTFVRHAGDRSKISPSQVLHLSPRAAGGYDVREVYLGTGEELSASSVAAVRGNRLLIGTVFDPKFLDCVMQ